MAQKPWMRDGEDWRAYQDRLNLWEQGERLIAEQKRSNTLAEGQMVNQQRNQTTIQAPRNNAEIDPNVIDKNFNIVASFKKVLPQTVFCLY